MEKDNEPTPRTLDDALSIMRDLRTTATGIARKRTRHSGPT